jgi:hypothetical protein
MSKKVKQVVAAMCFLMMLAACDDMLDAERPIYEKYLNQISVVGDAGPGGWDIDAVPRMIRSGGNRYTWTGYLNQGEIKFAWQKPDFLAGSWYMAASPGLEVEKNNVYSMVFVNIGEAKNNWKITEAGDYLITIDTSANTIKFEEIGFASIYLIGAATSAGWNLVNAVPLTKEGDGSWTWTGSLTTNNSGGGLKFICKRETGDTLAYSSSPELRPTVTELVPTGGEQELAYFPTGDTENNFCFKITEAGTYTITLYPNRRKVIIRKGV